MTAIFKNHAELLDAMRLIQDHLRDEYIVEECRDHPSTEGCFSCEAIKVWDGIEKFASEVEDDDLRSVLDQK